MIYILRRTVSIRISAEAGAKRNLEKAFAAFVNNSLVTLDLHDAKKLFDEMVDNTKKYLNEYLTN